MRRKHKLTKRRKRKREPIPKDVVDFVRMRDDNRCVYCGKKEAKKGLFRRPVKLQLGHHIPHSKGGDICVDNIQLECYACNMEKGTEVWEHSWLKLKFVRGARGCRRKCKDKMRGNKI